MRRAGLALLIALTACTSAAPAVTSPDATLTTSTPESRATLPAFTPCVEEKLTGLLCASIRVPLDYNDPAGEKIDVGIAMLRSKKSPSDGMLFTNPGGPGFSGREFLAGSGNTFEELRTTFDLVAIDPRGTSGTLHVKCGFDMARVLGPDITPDSAEDVSELVDTDKEYSRTCLERNNGNLEHVSTRESAMDMRSVADAFGIKEMNYLGFSYGSELGVMYASLYPERVGRFVLDGASDPRKKLLDRSLAQGLGFERTLGDFFSWCDARSCTPAKAESSFKSAAELVESDEVSVGTSKDVLTSGMFYLGTATALYNAQTYPVLATAINEALAGSGSKFAELFAAYANKQDDGTYGSELDALRAVLSRDDKSPTVEEQSIAAQEMKKLLPNFWPLFAPTAPHEDPWPQYKIQERPPLTNMDGKVVFVAATLDPATTYEDTVNLARDMNSAVITRVGATHTSFGASKCVKDAVISVFRGELQLLSTTKPIVCDQGE